MMNKVELSMVLKCPNCGADYNPEVYSQDALDTSLDVGSSIVQTPAQAIKALQLSRGMAGLLLVDKNGRAHLVWHAIDKAPKDGGRRLLQWIQEWQGMRTPATSA